MNKKWIDDPDYAEYIADQKESDLFYREKEMNTPRPGKKWCEADFIYEVPGNNNG